jgi:hypothetical protein
VAAAAVVDAAVLAPSELIMALVGEPLADEDGVDDTLDEEAKSIPRGDNDGPM